MADLDINKFDAFLNAYPAEQASYSVDSDKLKFFVEQTLGVEAPSLLIDFWRHLGSGYFGKKDLYFFGDGITEMVRDSFFDWNKKDFWSDIYPIPSEGGPVFFAETCFGDQIGFRWHGEKCMCILFCIDTFDAFVIANDLNELFSQVLIDRYSILDPKRLDIAHKALGELQPGMHYAPRLSPMLGGAEEISNFGFESPNVHFRTAIATYKALKEKQA